MNTNELSKLTLVQLKEICKQQKLKVSGKKLELIKRLLETNNLLPENEIIIQNTPLQKLKPQKRKSKSAKMKMVYKFLQEEYNHLIVRNQYAHYIHNETKLVFNPDTKYAIGKEDENGNILPLTSQDIENCFLFNFRFTPPETIEN